MTVPTSSLQGFHGTVPAAEPGISLFFWVARRDLLAPGGRANAFASLTIIAFCVTLIAAPLGLSLASGRADEQALRKKPLCIWVGDPTVANQLDNRHRALLDSELKSRLGPRFEYIRQFAFRELEYGWIGNDGRRVITIKLRGRTLSSDDPLWGKLLLQSGAPPVGPQAAVVMTRSALERLGVPADVESLEMFLPNSPTEKLRVQVAAVLADDPIPSGHDFAVTPECEQAVWEREPDTTYATLYSGPIDPAVEVLTKLSEETRQTLSEAFRANRLRWPPGVDKAGGVPRWKLHYLEGKEDAPLLSHWRKDILPSLAASLQRVNLNVPAGFEACQPPDADRPNRPNRNDPERLALYAEQRGLLPEVKLAARAAGLPVYEVVLDQLAEVERNSLLWFWVNLGVGAAVGLVALGILSMAMVGRVQQQKRPIGMLRAIGATDLQVRLTYLFVGILLWLPGLALGLVLAAALAGGAALPLGLPAEATPFWAWPTPALVGVMAGSGLVVALSTWVSTRAVVGSAPIELLRAERA